MKLNIISNIIDEINEYPLISDIGFEHVINDDDSRFKIYVLIYQNLQSKLWDILMVNLALPLDVQIMHSNRKNNNEFENY